MTNSIVFCVIALLQTPGERLGPHQAVLLDDYGPCGLTSLFIVCKLRDVAVEWDIFKELVGPTGSDGTHSFADLSRAATTIGMHPVALHVDRKVINELPMPAILQVHDPNNPTDVPHLLVLLSVEPDGVFILNPPYPPYFLPESSFTYTWTGKILVFARDEDEASWVRSVAKMNTWLSRFVRSLGICGAVLGLTSILWTWRLNWVKWLKALLVHVARRSVMRNAIIALMIAACFVGSYYWLIVQTKHAVPRCILDNRTHDLGELLPGKGDYTVSIANSGKSPLLISRVLSTCTCAKVSFPTEIDPGQKGNLQVQINVPPGPRSARLTIESNDPEGPKTVVLSWRGRVNVQLWPFKIEEQGIPNDKPYERTVRLIYPGGKHPAVPHLKDCECDSPLVELRARKNMPTATRFARSGLLTQVIGEQELQVKIKPPDGPGVFTSQCKLSVKVGDVIATLELPIRLYFIDGRLRPNLDTIVFSANSSELLRGQEREVAILGGIQKSDLRVEDVPSWLECKIIETKEGQALIRLKMVGLPPKSLVQGKLQIKGGKSAIIQTQIKVCVFAPTF